MYCFNLFILHGLVVFTRCCLSNVLQINAVSSANIKIKHICFLDSYRWIKKVILKIRNLIKIILNNMNSIFKKIETTYIFVAEARVFKHFCFLYSFERHYISWAEKSDQSIALFSGVTISQTRITLL